jgi:hypothetical protein
MKSYNDGGNIIEGCFWKFSVLEFEVDEKDFSRQFHELRGEGGEKL